MDELTVYRVQRWNTMLGDTPLDWPGGDYMNLTLAEAREDLQERGYKLGGMGRPGSRLSATMGNYMEIWAHPRTGVHWALSCR